MTKYQEVFPAICVSELRLARRTDDALAAGYTAILNLSESGYGDECPHQLRYEEVTLVDSEYCNVDQFMGAVEVLHELITGGHRVIVHCLAGISRSPSVVAAYLVRYRLSDLYLHRGRYVGLPLSAEYERRHRCLADTVLARREGLSEKVLSDPLFRDIMMAFDLMSFMRPQVYVRPEMWKVLFPQVRAWLMGNGEPR